MCGIVGVVSQRSVENILIDGLKRLEYRGYDSAGLSLINPNQQLDRLRTKGKVRDLDDLLQQAKLTGNTGIAHTRWATHGAPSENNAHPMMSAKHDIAIVHNGIIENHDELRAELKALGYQFTSETDTETVVHLLHYYRQQSPDLLSAVQKVVPRLQGAYALGIISANLSDCLIAVCKGCPLVIGKGNRENLIASDPLALASFAKEFIYLTENDIAQITSDKIEIYNNGQKVSRPWHTLEYTADIIDRGEYRHYMCKEIFEQPRALQANLEDRINKNSLRESCFGLGSDLLFKKIQQVQIIACGTSYHAAMVARYWIEALAGIPCSVEIASEFRYRHPVVVKNSLFVTLSQSGETADTLAALRLAKKLGYLATLSICNVPESTIVRESDLSFMTRAGIEIGVASTKAFTAQLTALLLLTISIGRHHALSPEIEAHLIETIQTLPTLITEILTLHTTIQTLSTKFIDKSHALFLGRGPLYPIALEGALKLKEISYIHAEGYPAGELKHGPLALVDKNMPVIALAPSDDLLEKIKSNLHEVNARGGQLFIFTDKKGVTEKNDNLNLIEMPLMDPILTPIAYAVPMQLLSYHVAVLKGTDVDQPRNLAKSVTVE